MTDFAFYRVRARATPRGRGPEVGTASRAMATTVEAMTATMGAPSRAARSSPRLMRTTVRTRRTRRVVRAASDDGARTESSASAESSGSSAAMPSALDRMTATTNALRAGFDAEPFAAMTEMLSANAEYDNDVWAVRGAREYGELMTHFASTTKDSLKRFRFETRRASCVEPGVLLIQWTARWDGAKFGKKMSNVLLDSMHEGAVRRLDEGSVDVGDIVATKARGESDDSDVGFELFGRTTYRVNRDGMIISREDRVDFRTDPAPGSQSEDESYFETPEEIEREWEQVAEETATNMFYNTLCPPGQIEGKWFLDVLIELEWQSFSRQMGDTSGVLSRQEYVSVIYVVLFCAVTAPIFILTGLTALLLSPDAATSVDPDSIDAAMSSLDAHATGANGSPMWDPEVFINLYKGKIGAL